MAVLDMNLHSASLAQLHAEIKRRKSTELSKEIRALAATRSVPKRKRLFAGEDLKQGVLVVVDEETGRAFATPETPVIPGKRRIAGYVIRDTKAKQRLKLRHWCFEDLIVG